MEPYQLLETKWAEFNGLEPRNMVACSSGTSALHLALEAMQLPPASEVLCPDLTMVACPRAIILAGLTPVFVDYGDDLLMDTSLVAGAIPWNNAGEQDLVTACMWVSVYGRVDQNDRQYLADLCRQLGLKYIEDLAEAHGVRPHPATDAACWSFYRNKIVAGEEGGAVWFRRIEHADRARQLRSLGFTAAHDFDHIPRGHNYRMSNLHAKYILNEWDDDCPGLAHRNGLSCYAINKLARREIEGWYDAVCPAEWRMPPRDAVWVYDLRLPFDWERDVRNPRFGLPSYTTVDRVVAALNAEGIAARHCFKPMSRQEEFRKCRRVYSAAADGCEVSRADMASAGVVYLPVQPGVTTESDCQRAFAIIKEHLN